MSVDEMSVDELSWNLTQGLIFVTLACVSS